MSSNNNTPQNRLPRDMETRDTFVRPEHWAPPDLLPAPIAQEGWEYRYIRTSIQGEDDPTNVNRARREGWEPVLTSEQPHLAAYNDRGARNGHIEIGGLLLCKAPTEFLKQREEYFRNMANQAQRAVDQNLMKEQDSRMPLFQERKTKVTFGSGG